MRRLAAVLVLLTACGGQDPASLDRAMFAAAADGSLQCGTWAAPASVTPACETPTHCTCDFACVEDDAGVKHSEHAEFIALPDAAQRWGIDFAHPVTLAPCI